MKYVNYLNSLLERHIADAAEIVLYGQNINAGSCLGGLTKGLNALKNVTMINSQNSENTLVGMGFGLMLNQISSVFFVKQSDFLLLGLDQLVNTYNVVRQVETNASFTIFPITVDSGFEGPQASLNNLDDFCSISGIPTFTFTNSQDASYIFSRHFSKPGMKIFSAGQRLLNEDTRPMHCVSHCPDGNYFQYESGGDATIVCFNNALPYGIELLNRMKAVGKAASLFSINSCLRADYAEIIANIDLSKKLVLFDDSKSRNRLSGQFLNDVQNSLSLDRKIVVVRNFSIESLFPCEDTLDVNYSEILGSL